MTGNRGKIFSMGISLSVATNVLAICLPPSLIPRLHFSLPTFLPPYIYTSLHILPLPPSLPSHPSSLPLSRYPSLPFLPPSTTPPFPGLRFLPFALPPFFPFSRLCSSILFFHTPSSNISTLSRFLHSAIRLPSIPGLFRSLYNTTC